MTGSGGGGNGWIDNLGEQKFGPPDPNLHSLYAISGVLTVPAAGTYAAWAAAHAGWQDAGMDFNHNGIPNGVEYFMGAAAAAPAALPPLAGAGGTRTWTIPYDPTAAVTWKFQVSDDLASWTGRQQGDPGIVISPDPDEIEFTLPAGMTFCRLVVTPVP